MKINYLVGDATLPLDDGCSKRIILHVCNDIGGWGRGFVLALSHKWKEPEQAYRKWYDSKENFQLGEIQMVSIPDTNIIVCNMIGQHDVAWYRGIPPVRYDAIFCCLNKVVDAVKDRWHSVSVHAPRFGSALAGGNWLIIEQLIIDTLIRNNIPVYIYDLPAPTNG